MLGLGLLLLALAGAFEHLLDGGEVDTLVLGKTDPGVLSLTNNEDVSDSGGEVGTSGISDVDDVETTEMSFTGSDDTDSSDVVTVGDCADVSRLELGVLKDGSGGDFELDGVVDGDIRVGESDGSTVVGNDVRDFVGADFLSDDFAELEFGFLRLNGSEGESSLNVEKNSEVLTRLVNGKDVHQTSGVLNVSSDLAVDFNTSFVVVDDHDSFSHGKRVLKTSLEDEGKRKTLSKLVGTLTGSGDEIGRAHV